MLGLASHISVFLELLLAMLLGMLLGAERTIAHKRAGLRTYGLVSLGACLFMVCMRVLDATTADLVHVVEGTITGIGFLGAGVIFLREQTTVGLTTAAGLWVAAGIGLTTGLGLYAIAIFTTLLTLLAFTVFWKVEEEVTHIGTGV